MVKGSDDVLRPLCAQEREVLMGFPRGYTMSLLKKVPEGAEEGRQAEDVRCAAIGNSFHVNTVAAILDLAFSAARLKKLKGVQRIVSEFVESLEMPPEPALVKDETVSEPGDELLQREDEEMTLAAVEGLTEWEASEGSGWSQPLSAGKRCGGQMCDLTPGRSFGRTRSRGGRLIHGVGNGTSAWPIAFAMPNI